MNEPGGGLTMVILPGMDGTGFALTSFIQALAPQMRATVVRYPVDAGLGYPELEALARAALPASGKYLLLGESFGGPLALTIAASRPRGLVGVVLCASFARYPIRLLRSLRVFTHMVPPRLAPDAVLSWLLLGRWNSPALVLGLRQSLALVSDRVLRLRQDAVLRVDVSALLPAIMVPLLYLKASEDRLVPPSAAALILAGVAKATVVELAGPHFLLQAAPQACAEAVQRFAVDLP